ncbi:MAG TPA: ABC transporter ATP-binding protein [Aggregatilineaceae bacterium]|nr:ABC transporter ATP-binding protein [Aggregatilineaceae bacterium]
MGDIAIRIENLGKMYRVGGPQERYHTLRDSLTDIVSAPFKRAQSLLRGQVYGAAGLHEEIWALKDVFFEVKQGEVVGIIGRNGAGKSTLLKILSRITEPTTGSVDIYGRVGALLEVGTGFHPELTGRENIFLSGAILGMSREEIDRKFDEIVDFAGVERFIDTPVKHYSSGMGLRLGFAVAAHLEPEILIVDEVLAVGDAAFQKKCLGKMDEVAGEGRTVLFVSHNMAAVSNLCSRSVLLSAGHLIFDGDSEVTIDHYLNGEQIASALTIFDESDHNDQREALITHLQIRDTHRVEKLTFSIGEPIRLEIGIYSDNAISDPQLGIGVDNALGQRIFTVSTRIQDISLPSIQGSATIVCELPVMMLAPGRYMLKLAFGAHLEDLDVITGIAGFEVLATDYFGSGRLFDARQGVIYVTPTWSFHQNLEIVDEPAQH